MLPQRDLACLLSCSGRSRTEISGVEKRKEGGRGKKGWKKREGEGRKGRGRKERLSEKSQHGMVKERAREVLRPQGATSETQERPEYPKRALVMGVNEFTLICIITSYKEGSWQSHDAN